MYIGPSPLTCKSNSVDPDSTSSPDAISESLCCCCCCCFCCWFAFVVVLMSLFLLLFYCRCAFSLVDVIVVVFISGVALLPFLLRSMILSSWCWFHWLCHDCCYDLGCYAIDEFYEASPFQDSTTNIRISVIVSIRISFGSFFFLVWRFFWYPFKL